MTPTQTPVSIPTSPTPVTTVITPPVGVPIANFTGTPTSGLIPLAVVLHEYVNGNSNQVEMDIRGYWSWEPSTLRSHRMLIRHPELIR